MNSTVANKTTGNQTYPTTGSAYRPSGQLQPTDDLLEYAIDYARQNPGTAALWCFGIGFILGWKLKPW